MKVAHIGDLHLMRSRLDGKEGQLELLRQVAQEIVESGAELCLLSGDLSGHTVPHRAAIEERNALLEFVAIVSAAMPIVIARGNHDTLGEWKHLNSFRRKLKDGKWSCPVRYVEKPEILAFQDFTVAVMPWIDEASFDGSKPWARALVAEYKSLAEELDPNETNFALIHGAFDGAFIREGQPTIPTTDPLLSIDGILKPGLYTAAFVGHYHQFQKIPGKTPAYYGGSLYPSTFGEPAEKGWVLWSEAHGHRLVQLDQPCRVKITMNPKTQEVETVEPPVLNWVGRNAMEIADYLENKRNGRHLVKLDYRGTEADTREFRLLAAKIKESARKAGLALVVQAEIERPVTTREGASRVAKAKSIADKFVEWAQSRDPAPPLKLIERARARIQQADQAA